MLAVSGNVIGVPLPTGVRVSTKSLMFTPVKTLLPAKTADIFVKFWVIYLVGKMAHAVDKEFFTQWEGDRHGVEPGGFEGVIIKPVACQ